MLGGVHVALIVHSGDLSPNPCECANHAYPTSKRIRRKKYVVPDIIMSRIPLFCETEVAPEHFSAHAYNICCVGYYGIRRASREVESTLRRLKC